MNIDNNKKQIKIKITDVTLREWDQAPLTSFNKIEKQIIALMLAELGVYCIEVWFWLSRADAENIKAVKELFLQFKGEYKSKISSLWRALQPDTEASLELLSWYNNSKIHIFIATPDSHINSKFKSKWENLKDRRKWVLNQIKTEVSRAKTYKDKENKNLEIEFSPEAASDSAINKEKLLDFKSEQFSYLIDSLVIAIKAWADILNIPDTVWNLLPHETESLFSEIYSRLEYLKKQWYIFEYSCHIHNDLALSWANAISAIRGWVNNIETTILWIWERAWNTNISDIIWIISEKWKSITSWTKFDWYEVVLPNIKIDLIWPISRFIERILNLNKWLQMPFIWALSNHDWSWVHNASSNLYGWSKDKSKYWWAMVEDFFSPRWGINQIINMLSYFWIKEDKKSELIQELTQFACEKSEITKALYKSNIYEMYLSLKWLFKIEYINISEKKFNICFYLFWKKVELSWEIKWENGLIIWIINEINKFLWKETIIFKDIKIIKRPSLKWAIDIFYKELSYNNSKVSNNFTTEVDKIIWNSDFMEASVINLKLDILWSEINSISYWKDIKVETIKAVIYWCLGEFDK